MKLRAHRWFWKCYELKLHLLPIRDWNNLWESLAWQVRNHGLKLHLLPIRDWNRRFTPDKFASWFCWNFTYSLLGIETCATTPTQTRKMLKLHLLPIRDWNKALAQQAESDAQSWNFTYSLLGIETSTSFSDIERITMLKLHLLPIRDWN